MKTTKCNGQDVAKISDVEGKGMCKNPEYVDYLKRSIDWRMNQKKILLNRFVGYLGDNGEAVYHSCNSGKRI